MNYSLLKKSLIRYDFNTVFSKIKYDIDIENYYGMLSKLRSDKSLKQFFNNRYYPNNIKMFGKLIYVGVSKDATREIAWIATELSFEWEKINLFLEMKKKFEAYALKGQYLECIEMLDKVQEKFGYSYWHLDNYIWVISKYKGFKEQREYADNFFNNDQLNISVRAFSNYYSLKAEDNISYYKYNWFVEDLMGDDPILKAYIGSKLNIFNNDAYNFEGIFNLIDQETVIDKYETFVKILIMFLSDNKHTVEVSYALDILSKKIRDSRLENGLSYFNETPSENEEEVSRVLDIIDLYTSGEYEKCIVECRNEYQIDKVKPELIEIYTKSCIQLKIESRLDEYDENSLINRIVDCYYQLYLKTNRMEEAIANSLKVICEIQSQSISFAMYSVIIDELTNDGRLNYGLGKAGLLYYCKNTIMISKLYNDQTLSNDFLNKYSEKLKQSVTIKLFKATEEDFVEKLSQWIPHYRLYKQRIIELFNKGEYDVLIELLSSSERIKLPELYNDYCTVYLFNSYLKLGDVKNALENIVNIYLNKRGIINKISVNELDGLITESNDEDTFQQISYPIFAEILYKKNNKDDMRAVRCEEYLELSGFNEPLNVEVVCEINKRRQLVFFLDKVCIIPVLDSLPQFKKSIEVMKYRVSILNKLLEIDPINGQKYIEEMKSITHNIVIKEGILNIERSKIYVDVEGIKATLSNLLKEDFASFKEHLKLVTNSRKPSIQNYYSKIISGMDEIIAVPSNPRDLLLLKMIGDIRERFVSSDQYGLDGYLSVGIRHGTLEGELVKSLKAQSLLYPTKESIADIVGNDYDEEQNERIWTLLTNFSCRFESIVSDFKQNYLQISTEEDCNRGMFKYNYYSEDVDAIYDYLEPSTTLNEFIDYVIEMLWQKTEANLVEVKDYITSDLTQQIRNCFEEADKDLSDMEEVRDIISTRLLTAKTSLLNDIHRVSEWFTMNQEVQVYDYNILVPFGIAKELIVSINPDKKIRFSEQITCQKIYSSKSLKHLVDIFYTILDNVVKRSELDSIECNVECFSDKSGSTIRVSNNFNPSITDKITKSIDNSKNKISSTENYMKFINVECGSGIPKIKKTLDVDLHCRHKLDFFVSEDLFTIEIVINEVIF